MKISEIKDEDTFKCDKCEGVFDRVRSSVEAIQEEMDRRAKGEYSHLGPDPWPDQVSTVCDDCHKEFMKWVEDQKMIANAMKKEADRILKAIYKIKDEDIPGFTGNLVATILAEIATGIQGGREKRVQYISDCCGIAIEYLDIAMRIEGKQ